jgi:CBS domain-containing protein
MVPRGSQVRRAIDLVLDGGVAGVVVANDDGSPAGVFTETDVVRRVIAADRHPWVTTVESVMTEPVVSVEEDCPLDVAGRLMADRGIRHLGMTRERGFVGWVTARALIAAGGVKAIPVREAMTRLLATIHFRETVREAADRMLEASIGLLLVGGRRTRHRPGQLSTDGHDDLAGILTESDLVSRVMAVDRYPYVTSVGDVMTSRLVTVGPEDSLTDAAELIVHQGVRHVVVTDGGEVVGVVSIRDLLGAIPAQS